MSASPEPELDTATVHLRVFDQDREISFPVRVGPCTVRDLLPAARALSARVSALAVEHAEAEGRTVSCKAGCAACCHHLIAISSVEAAALAERVAAMPPERQAAVRGRFAAAVARMEAIGVLDPAGPRGRAALISRPRAGESAWEHVSRAYFEARIPCPFLEGDRCGIYEERPIVCREYQVTTPATLCSTLSAEVRDVERPIRVGDALGAAAGEIAGIDGRLIPLALLLEWAEAHGAALEGERDGEEMFWALLRQLDSEGATPFDEREGDG
jgi:Fe-S-cluster containining protein